MECCKIEVRGDVFTFVVLEFVGDVADGGVVAEVEAGCRSED